jgi:serine/threonine-protein kinase HipA
MSVQPAFDAGQIRRNEMKLALAVGDNRHYVVYEIMPRHFVQTAVRNGIAVSLVHNIFDELLDTHEAVVNKVTKNLPAGFPQELAESIVGGLRSRLQLVEKAGAGAAP